VVELAPRLAAKGIAIKGVRLDSGDLAEHARRVRAILDAGGLGSVTIFASGNLDEYRLAALGASGAPIDGYGVGTRMNTSADAPYFDCAYKLQEYDGEPRRKRSEGKATWPGRKQVWRRYGAEGRFAGDTLSLAGDPQTGEPLLVPVVRGGQLACPRPSLASSRELAKQQLGRLPEALRSLDPAKPPYPVVVAEPLRQLAARIDART
jgi:nicotinate phosphoribosyltransferase